MARIHVTRKKHCKVQKRKKLKINKEIRCDYSEFVYQTDSSVYDSDYDAL